MGGLILLVLLIASLGWWAVLLFAAFGVVVWMLNAFAWWTVVLLLATCWGILQGLHNIGSA